MAVSPLLKTILCVLPFILISLWAIWHSFRHTFDSPQERRLWICFAVFVPFVGGLLYLLIGRRRARGSLR